VQFAKCDPTAASLAKHGVFIITEQLLSKHKTATINNGNVARDEWQPQGSIENTQWHHCRVSPEARQDRWDIKMTFLAQWTADGMAKT